MTAARCHESALERADGSRHRVLARRHSSVMLAPLEEERRPVERPSALVTVVAQVGPVTR
jgi:hypothetical protein